jgi:signal transduction histidine kinase
MVLASVTAALRANLDYACFAAVSILVCAGLYIATQRRAAGIRVPSFVYVMMTVITLTGWFLVHHAGNHERRIRAALIEGMAPTYAIELSRMGHARISMNTPPDDPVYLALIQAEIDWLNVNSAVHDIYTFRRDAAGKIIFIVDSETDYNRNGRIDEEREERTDIGEEYEVQDEGMEAALSGKFDFDSTPAADRWGTWVSAMAPIYDESGQVEAVLGVDYDATEWVRGIQVARWLMIGLLFVIQLVLVATATTIALLQKGLADRDRTQKALAQQQAVLEHLVEERTQSLLDVERQLFQQEKLASVGQLAAGVAHEINTPIQYIGDNLRALAENFDGLFNIERQYRELVELIKTGAPSAEPLDRLTEAVERADVAYLIEDTPKAIAQSLEGVERVAHIVRAMKDFSHADRGEWSAVDINRNLESTLTIARNEYKYVADLETEFGDVPLIPCCASELNQVFLNLVVNAAHAIGDTKKHGKITIRSKLVGDSVEISIADTGAGIPEAIRKRIFDPFFTTKGPGKGTGQGLSIAHSIVVGKHGGTLTFESAVGVGTTFIVRLPVQNQRAARVC